MRAIARYVIVVIWTLNCSTPRVLVHRSVSVIAVRRHVTHCDPKGSVPVQLGGANVGLPTADSDGTAEYISQVPRCLCLPQLKDKFESSRSAYRGSPPRWDRVG